MAETPVRRRGGPVLPVLRGGDGEVAPVELFFDLVYVFAVTQLSHLLVSDQSLGGVLRATVLLAMVWQIWIYTTWLTNYLDPDRMAVRALLVALMLGSLVFAAELPSAFTDRGLLVAALYTVLQFGRSLVAGLLVRRHELSWTFRRLAAWTSLAGVAALAGAAVHGNARAAWWALAVAIELGGAAVGFWTPGIGRSTTRDWTINGDHFAERCQAFVLIALGESVVVTGARLSDLHAPDGSEVAAFVAAFAGSVALWWIYFDRAAGDSAELIAASDDPGRLGRSAFHWIHPVMVAGIIVAAAGDEVVLDRPTGRAGLAAGWLVLGGAALYLFGHALFKAVVWRRIAWPRLAGAAVLVAAVPLARHVAGLTLAIAAVAVVVAVAISDRVLHPWSEPSKPSEPSEPSQPRTTGPSAVGRA